MITHIEYDAAGNPAHVWVVCDYCGAPTTRSGSSGMTCEDRCTDAWVRWHRLSQPVFRAYLERLGRGSEADAERDALAMRLFREDGSPKFSGPRDFTVSRK